MIIFFLNPRLSSNMDNMKFQKFTPEQKRNHDLRHYPVRPHVGVGGVIIWEKQILLIKRKYNPFAGKWAIPGGHLKLGEKTQAGALRECQEETGLKLQIAKFAGIIDLIDHDSSGKYEYHYVLIDYYMNVVGHFDVNHPPIPKAQSDVKEAVFVSFSDLNKYDLTRTTKELLKQLDTLQ
ncbi:MAG: DNA mismatch repair protein MutT [Promethearchaeia archaeon]|nr:MAG: DNA mismatch repair protein MutT [Candidatus Lokiarchaeia archaeon]